MKAHQNVAIYCIYPKNTITKRMKDHKKRLKEAKPMLTPSTEPRISPRSTSPSKVTDEIKPGTQAYVAKHNLILAKRIFEIMEGPGIISNLMESSTTENHPGTINFPHRLANARRIHQENLAMASRLDSVKAYYDSKTLAAMSKQKQNFLPKKIKFVKREKSLEENPTIFDQHGRVVLGKNALHINQTSSTFSTHDANGSPKRAKNVLLEYTKIQKGRVLDVAVIKEPFRDNYCIFGIDIDNGQRYELKLSSEEVSNILEGDILVTSVDNVEVWMTLLTKVELQPVEAFAKIPLPAPPSSHRTHNNNNNNINNNHNHYQSPDHTSIPLEDESLLLHSLPKSSTPEFNYPSRVPPPISTSSSLEPQTDSPKSQKLKQISKSPGSNKNLKKANKNNNNNNNRNSNDSLETMNTDADNDNDIDLDTQSGIGAKGGGRGGGGGNDSGSILTAGDLDDNRYTLDEYYDSKIQLTPLPLSDSSNAMKQVASDPFGDAVTEPYYDQMDDTTMLQNRPSARSASRDQRSSNNTTHPLKSTNTETEKETKPTHSTKIILTNEQIVSKYAESTMMSIMTSVLRDLQLKVKLKNEKKEEGMKSKQGEIKSDTEGGGDTTRKKSTASNSSGIQKRMTVNNANKPNPYRSTKVSTGGRSHSIRYTTEESTNVSAGVGVSPLQPVPPTETPSTKQQQSNNIRKQSVNASNNSTRRQSAPNTSIKPAIAPVKPQDSMPSARRPSKQTTTTTNSNTTSSKNSTETSSPRKASTITTNTTTNNNKKKTMTTEAANEHVNNCRTLALSITTEVIELAQQNIQKILEMNSN